jgi:hypothetical protein
MKVSFQLALKISGEWADREKSFSQELWLFDRAVLAR